MRVQLKGLKVVTKRLADGRKARYYYAWVGGPRIEGEPGSIEFTASYNAAIASKPRNTRAAMLCALTDAYQDSGDFLGLADRTRQDYTKLIKQIVAEFGEMPIAALADRRTRAEFMTWRDGLAKKSRRQADYAWTVLARVLSWSVDRGLSDANPCAKGGRLYSGSRADKTWSVEDIAAFRTKASPALSLALTLALWTGQRQGDLLRLTWSDYDGAAIRLKQSKTGRRVMVPVGTPLKTVLDSTKRESPRVLVNNDGIPWTPDGFRVSWRKACIKAKVKGVTFHDLRGTAVLNLALAGATEAEIATITGHSLKDVRSTLDASYLSRDNRLAESGIRKLESVSKLRATD